jgi:hypothetical protein
MADVKNIVLPFNNLVGKLFNEKNLFKIYLTAFDQATGYTTMNSDGRSVITQSNTSEVLANLDIIYNQQTLPIVHSHKYEGDALSTVSNVLNSLQSTIGGVTPAQVVGNMSESGNTYSRTGYFASTDLAPIYKGSAPPEITVSFTLFAYDNPLNEVLIPCQLLTYLTYPRSFSLLKMKKSKTPDEETKKDIDSVRSKVNAMGLGIRTPNASVANMIYENNKLESLDDRAVGKQEAPEGFRFVNAKAPPRWTLRTSNNTFALETCHCSSITVTYYGPWIGRPKITDDEAKYFKMITDGFRGVGAGISEATKEIYSRGTGGEIKPITDSSSSGLPCYADIQMKFTSNYTYMYAEEWLINNKGETKAGDIHTELMEGRGARESSFIGLRESDVEPTVASGDNIKDTASLQKAVADARTKAEADKKLKGGMPTQPSAYPNVTAFSNLNTAPEVQTTTSRASQEALAQSDTRKIGTAKIVSNGRGTTPKPEVPGTKVTDADVPTITPEEKSTSGMSGNPPVPSYSGDTLQNQELFTADQKIELAQARTMERSALIPDTYSVTETYDDTRTIFDEECANHGVSVGTGMDLSDEEFTNKSLEMATITKNNQVGNS